jgi:23S rRNA (uracil1939-C5)-methyltransferase
VIDLKLTAMAHGGSALGRHEGRVVFVPYAIPGERVRAEIVETHARWAQARLVDVLEPSPYRIDGPCPFFGPGKCAGCQIQHIGYEAQVEFKRQVVIDQLQRIGGLGSVDVQEVIGASHPWDYCNSVQFSVTQEGLLAFQRANLPELIPVDVCLIIDPLLDELWGALDVEWPQLERLTLRCGSGTGDQMAIFELGEYEDFDIEVDFPVSCVIRLPDGEPVVLMGSSSMAEHVAGRDYRISATSSFRDNTAAAEGLVELVREYLAPSRDETLLDVYSGVGLYGLALAGEAARVIAVEPDASAAADLRANAQDVPHVEIMEEEVSAALTRLGPLPGSLLVLDPPRAGAGAGPIGEIARLGPQRIAYVSSDPAALARDARLLVDAGYRLKQVQPVDAAPQTYRIDSVSLFTRDTVG